MTTASQADMFTANELFALVRQLAGLPRSSQCTVNEEFIAAARQIRDAHERMCEGLRDPLALTDLVPLVAAWRADSAMLDAVLDALSHTLDIVAGAAGDCAGLAAGCLEEVQPIAAHLAAEGGSYRAKTVLAAHLRRIAEESRQRRRAL